MYLRGDIFILVPAVFSEIVAILTAPAVIVTIKMACEGQKVTVTIRPLQNNPGRKIRSLIV